MYLVHQCFAYEGTLKTTLLAMYYLAYYTHNNMIQKSAINIGNGETGSE